jgi:branched-chain amino acid transport system permease protein
VLAFVISSMWAGVAGALGAHLIQYANPSAFNFVRGVEIVVMVVLGGLGSISGAAIMAIVLQILAEVLRTVSGAFAACLLLIALVIWWSVPRHRDMLQKNPPKALLQWLCGPAISAVALVYLYLTQREWLEANVSSLRFVIYGVILIVLMLLRPQGLMGRSELGWWVFRLRRPQPQKVP